MRFDIITIFPEMFAGVFSGGVVKKALDKEVVRIAVHDLRDFTTDKHRQVDDRPFGGLEGMVLKPEPIFRAVEALRGPGRSKVFLLSPAHVVVSGEAGEAEGDVDASFFTHA